MKSYTNCFFKTCKEAVLHTMETKTFGAYFSEDQEPNLEIHIHECCELLLCMSGGKSFLIDDRVYDVQDGDLFIVNQFEAHKITPMPDKCFSRFILHVHPTFLYSNSDAATNLASCFYREDGSPNRILLSSDEQIELIHLFNDFDVFSDYGIEIYKKIAALKILLAVNRMFETHNDSVVPPVKHKTIQLAIDYINNNYSQAINLEMIAKNSYVSINQLCRLFNRYCSTTVTKYITSKRITEAKKHLANGTNVTDVTFMCGFNDYANFIRVFKKTVGMSPGKYKAKCQSN